jgi:hypothetical protein
MDRAVWRAAGDRGSGLKAGGGELAFEVEFAGAEAGVGFADGGEAFAGGGVAGAADDAGDAVEEGEVGRFVGAGEGEFEGELFEEAEGCFGEVVGAVGGELEDFGGGGGSFG